VPPPRPKVSASPHAVGSAAWQAEFLAPAVAKGLDVPDWLRRQLAALGPYAKFWRAWSDSVSAPVPPPAAVFALTQCQAGPGVAPWAGCWTALLVLAVQPNMQNLVSAAIIAWDHDGFDEKAVRVRAQTAGAAVLAAAGVPVRSSMKRSHPQDYAPDAGTVRNLRRLMAQTIQLPPRPPVTAQEQPDRHPWEEDPVRSVAVVGVPLDSWTAAAGSLGVPVAWFSDGAGDWPSDGAECLWVQTSWYPFLRSASPSVGGGGDQAVWKALQWVQTHQPKCVVFDLQGSALSAGRFAAAGQAELVLCALARALGYEQTAEVADLRAFGIPMVESRCMVRWCARSFRDRWGSLARVKPPDGLNIVDNSFDWHDDMAVVGAERLGRCMPAASPHPGLKAGEVAVDRSTVPWFAGSLPVHHTWSSPPLVGMCRGGLWRTRPLTSIEERWIVQHELLVAAFFTDTCLYFTARCRFRPANCDSVEDARARIGVPPAVRERWQRAMHTLARDHATRCRNGDSALQKQDESRERPRHTSRFQDSDGQFFPAVPPEA
jgi:hypothetical protein